MPTTDTFTYTGADQTFVVPIGVTSITVDCQGAEGGATTSPRAGGKGGRVVCDLSVTPGETLHITVGGKPSTSAGGWPDGGTGGDSNARGGGGSSDVRQGGSTLADRVVAAGGGGGAGLDQGDPGDAGGDGGGGNGTAGQAGASGAGAAGGAGATGSAGGAGGAGVSGGGSGTAGALGEGGDGAAGGPWTGGGGGGGLYGGGGGGCSNFFTRGGGGGGGGSGLGTGVGQTLTSGYRSGHGQVALTYVIPDVIDQPAGLKATKLLWLYDLFDTQTMAIDSMLAFEIDDRLQDSETLRFTIAADDPKAEFVLLDTLVRYRQLPGGAPRFWRITRRDPGRDGTRAVIAVEAEARWTELAGRVIPGHFLITEETPEDGLDLIILHRDYGWTVGTVDAPPFAWYGIDKTDATILELLREWAKDTGCELVFDTAARTVSLIPSQGETRDLGFRYAWNLRDIKRRETPPEVTRLYPYGRNGLTISALSPDGTEHIDDFSYYIAQGLTAEEAEELYLREKIWKDDAFISDGPLYDAAVARLTALAQPVAAYEAKVVDLTGSGLPVHVEIGDTVPVRDTTLGISIRTRVVRLLTRPLAPHDNEIELAYLQGRPDDSSSSRAANNGEDWLLFLYESLAPRTIDLNLAIIADLGLQFVSGGETVHHFDAEGIATGSGTLEITFYEELEDEIVGPVIYLDFADGDLIHIPAAWSLDGLSGNRLFSVRIRTGLYDSGSVDFAAGAVRYSILAKGALGVSLPPDDNSVTFLYNGTDGFSDGSTQTWEVPPDVTSVVVDCYGASGRLQSKGGRIRARFPVIAGETLDVNVGGQPLATASGGFNGGGGGAYNYTVEGGGGGGASDVRRGSTLADRLIVAGGGGGNGAVGFGDAPPHDGGDGGYPDGADGDFDSDGNQGRGGTQTAGGAAAGGSATAGTLGDGGMADNPGSIVLGTGGGGGGGGLYGGGGALSNTSSHSSGGGAGSSGTVDQDPLIDDRPSTATELFVENAVNSGHGKVIISWDTP